MVSIIKRINNSTCFAVAVILLISTVILIFDLPRVDDVPYFAVVESDLVELSRMTDMTNDEKISFIGLNPASAEVTLTGGDIFRIRANMTNTGEEDVVVFVDLNAPEYDRGTEEATCVVTPGTDDYEFELSYYREAHPEQCLLRFFSYAEGIEIRINDIQVDMARKAVGGNRTVSAAIVINGAILLVTVVFIAFFLISRRKAISFKLPFERRDFVYWIFLMTMVLIGVFYLYRESKLDYPLIFAGIDDFGVYYLVRTIKEFGYTLINHRSGGLSGGDMFDYVYSDKLSFIIVKLISLFVDNVYVITNLLYFSAHFLIATTAFISCKRIGIKSKYALVVSVLYTFTCFIQMRLMHMWLVQYYTLPLACMIAIDIGRGTLDEKERKIFPVYLLVSFVCGFTGMYYAFFSCAVFGIGMLIHLFDEKQFCREKLIKPFMCILSCSFAVLINVIPNLVYHLINGPSPLSEYSQRSGAESEYYALKLVQLLLPRPAHRIPLLAQINAMYAASYPLVTENNTVALGVVAGVGFLIALIEVIIGKSKASVEARMITAVFLVATVGGIGSVISVFIFWPMRCYNRFSLVIMFLSLVLVVGYLSRLIERRVNNRVVSGAILAIIILTGFLDQTKPFTLPDYTPFESDRNFIHYIENQMEPDDMIFVLPVLNWPGGSSYKNHIGYIESDHLKWSYGAMQGREEAVWQQKVAAEDADLMIQTLRNTGYDGIYFDSGLYAANFGTEAMTNVSFSIANSLGYLPDISENGSLYFWNIKE